jgi:hypothetical protein
MPIQEGRKRETEAGQGKSNSRQKKTLHSNISPFPETDWHFMVPPTSQTWRYLQSPCFAHVVDIGENSGEEELEQVEGPGIGEKLRVMCGRGKEVEGNKSETGKWKG